MPIKPNESLLSRLCGAMPTPLSLTLNSRRPSGRASSTSTRLAPAWRRTLLSFSCNVRNSTISISGAIAPNTASSGSVSEQARPLRLRNSPTCHSSAACKPRSSTAGRNSFMIPRTLLMVVSTFSSTASTRWCRRAWRSLVRALSIDISMLSARTSERHARLHQRVDAVLENVDTTISSVRGIMNELRPAVLDLGLQAALEWQVGEFRKRSGLACSLTLPDDAVFGAIAPEMEIVLFRTLQEALSNVRRHAGASRVDVLLARPEGRLLFSVSDNEIGIAPHNRDKSDSFGL